MGLFVTVAILLTFAWPALAVSDYTGWLTMTVKAYDNTQMSFIRSLPVASKYQRHVRILKQAAALGRATTLIVSNKMINDLKLELVARGFTGEHQYRVTGVDFQKALDAAKGKVQGVSYIASKYLTVAEAYAYLKKLAQEYPNAVQLEAIGEKTHEGRSLVLVKVGKGAGKPAIWIDAGIHAREWIGPATALYMLTKLVTEKANKQYIDNLNWYFLPLANPDGYQYSYTRDATWRKNRRPAPESCRGAPGCCEGVDINRNFDYDYWREGGASNNMCKEDYRGRSPFTEPESRAIRDFSWSHKDIKAAITLHSYSQMWFIPYGDGTKTSDYNELKALADRGAQALKAVSGTTYKVGSSQVLLDYSVSGSSDDWMKNKTSIKYVYCLELRPDEDNSIEFYLPPSFIKATGEETWAGVKVVADQVIREFSRNPASDSTGQFKNTRKGAGSDQRTPAGKFNQSANTWKKPGRNTVSQSPSNRQRSG